MGNQSPPVVAMVVTIVAALLSWCPPFGDYVAGYMGGRLSYNRMGMYLSILASNIILFCGFALFLFAVDLVPLSVSLWKVTGIEEFVEIGEALNVARFDTFKGTLWLLLIILFEKTIMLVLGGRTGFVPR